MFAKRLPVLSAFAGGCLSGAALIGFWLADGGTTRAPAKRATHTAEVAAAPAGRAPEHADESEIPAARAAERHDAPSLRDARAHTADTEVASPKSGDDATVETLPAESGSSVAEVLARLEAAYRKELDAAATPAAPVTGRDGAAVVPSSASLAAERAPAPAPTAVAEAPPEVATPAAVALAAPPAKPAAAPAAIPAPAERGANVNVSSVSVGTNVGNVYVDNARPGEPNQIQQVTVFQYVPQYLPFYAVAPYPIPSSARRNTSQSGRVMNPRREPTSPTAMMNPDNPWGFDFPPTILVK